jgi:hypothetical protein
VCETGQKNTHFALVILSATTTILFCRCFWERDGAAGILQHATILGGHFPHRKEPVDVPPGSTDWPSANINRRHRLTNAFLNIKKNFLTFNYIQDQ